MRPHDTPVRDARVSVYVSRCTTLSTGSTKAVSYPRHLPQLYMHMYMYNTYMYMLYMSCCPCACCMTSDCPNLHPPHHWIALHSYSASLMHLMAAATRGAPVSFGEMHSSRGSPSKAGVLAKPRRVSGAAKRSSSSIREHSQRKKLERAVA